MKIDVNNAITVISGLLLIIGAIYRLSQVESNINAKITKVETSILTTMDQLEDKLAIRFHDTEKKLDIHLTEYSEKKVFLDYRLNATDKAIEHKFNRLANWIKQITGFLGKESNFQIRDDQF
ncbi:MULTISPECIES: hypothetical protein [Calothrix]|uniref:Uncharacterized protein n=2 Tax=Calothrix TaxID=1186 RepID=A0ABR8AD55_9CYAN|nr:MULTISPECIES: hypothetical protein [Calothrix]MBD2197946.1 hypothetical protein [Calothrix parietina FACHB-288]MBD2226769.1 hypothetical protein [Calothrix anomala FACHB-343]